MALAAKQDLKAYQLNADNAFTNAYLKEPIYCRTTPQFEHAGECLKAIRTLYELRESFKLGQKKLLRTLTELKLTKTEKDQFLFVSMKLIVIILLYKGVS